ncbi:multidrug resistance protein MdtK [Elysia marginata]|uniref:Multidrug and toxin extrusion protein n=1 Tax=Elysia marginata TaxID=1093978 RepID=A0AAV4IUX4_9GAST|nr:multidrug resistance protein MdtK [Elysia marginata]
MVWREARTLLRLALPLAAAQLVMCLAGLVDTLMAGHYSAADLAAVAVGFTVWIPINVFLVGLLMCMTAFVAHLVGAGQHSKIPDLIHQGFRLSLLFGVPELVLVHLSPPLLTYTGLNPETREIATGYLHAVAWGMPGVALNQLLRSYLEGLEHTRPVMMIQLLSLALNIPFNYVMIHGKLGLPALGGVGCGYATALIMWLAPLFMLAYIALNPELRHTSPLRRFAPLQRDTLYALLKVGTPIGCTLFFQFLAFTLITLLLTPSGDTVLGAHQIAFNLSTLPMVLASGIGIATSIRVGQAVGANNRELARFRGQTGILSALSVAIGMALLIYGNRAWLAALYTNDIGVITLAIQLLPLVALYHIFDSLQVSTNAALRGYKDTRTSMLTVLSSLWGIALPLGSVLALKNWLIPAQGAMGFWIALCIALSFTMLLVQRRYQKISQSKDVESTTIEMID